MKKLNSIQNLMVKRLKELNMPYFKEELIKIKRPTDWQEVELNFCLPYHSLAKLMAMCVVYNYSIAYGFDGKIVLSYHLKCER